MGKTILYKKNFHVDLRDVDFQSNLKISSLFSYFQEIANLAANNLGVGIEHLAKNLGYAWVLVKMRVDIKRLPKVEEEVVIKTWPLPPSRVEFERDFLVIDKSGEVIIRAVSSWVIMDIKNRKLKRTLDLNLTYPEIITERAINEKISKLNSFGNLQPSYNKVIGYSDIDFNGHLNNSKYIDYMMDCFSMENHKQYRVASLEIQFVNEMLPGETLALYIDESMVESSKIYIEGINKENEKSVFKSQITLEKIE